MKVQADDDDTEVEQAFVSYDLGNGLAITLVVTSQPRS